MISIVFLHVDAVYGSGINCDNATTQSEVTGDFVYSLVSQLVTDFDDDYIGLIVIGTNYGEGIWQYSRGNWNGIYPTHSSGTIVIKSASIFS